MSKKKPPVEKFNLSPKEKKFCKEFIVDYIGARAAIRAGYPEKNARRIACELRTKLDITRYIAKLEEEVDKELQVSRNDILQKLKIITTTDITDLLDERGNLDIANLPPELSYAIEEYSTTTTYDKEGNPKTVEKVKMMNKTKALEMLAKYKNLYAERLEITGKDGAELPGLNIQLPPGAFK